VRLIRAVRFAAKLSARGFALEPKTAKPLVAMRDLLADVPQSRMFDEMLKLLQTGHAIASVQQLRQLGLDAGVYPLLDLIVARADEPMVHAALADTDRRVGEGKGVAPSFLLACVLWQDVLQAWNQYQNQGEHPHPALQQAIDDVFASRIGDVSGRGKLGADMREIWLMQPRFEKRTGKAPFGLVEQPRFRASFDFLRLRCETGETDVTLADWWQTFSQGDEGTREALMQELKQERTGKRGQGGRVHRVPRGTVSGQAHETEAAPATEGDVDGDAPLEEGSAPAKKRRRRRRKPANRTGNPDAPDRQSD
jgi:poly(A) polymerase